jgi:hypothetical protein
LYQSAPADASDWYKFYAESGQNIFVSMQPPSGVDFNLELYDPNATLRAESHNGAGWSDCVSCTADSTGNWSSRIWLCSGEGQCFFSVNVYWPDGGGGEGNCPTLFVWNSTGYVNYGVVDIHDPSGRDVVNKTIVNMTDIGLNNYLAEFRLREGWPGINISETAIDQVRLYAVDNYGHRRLCPLISARHSRLGNVLLQLLFSDNWKTETLLLETIDLTFFVPYQNIQSYIFVIEGCNWLKQ